MKSKFPYCDQTDCKHFESCQSEQNILLRTLQQSPESIKLHNSCRFIMKQLWDKEMLNVHIKYQNNKTSGLLA